MPPGALALVARARRVMLRGQGTLADVFTAADTGLIVTRWRFRALLRSPGALACCVTGALAAIMTVAAIWGRHAVPALARAGAHFPPALAPRCFALTIGFALGLVAGDRHRPADGLAARAILAALAATPSLVLALRAAPPCGPSIPPAGEPAGIAFLSLVDAAATGAWAAAAIAWQRSTTACEWPLTRANGGPRRRWPRARPIRLRNRATHHGLQRGMSRARQMAPRLLYRSPSARSDEAKQRREEMKRSGD